MAKIKVAKAIGPVLDFLAAKCEKLPIKHDPMGFGSGSEAGFWIWPEKFPREKEIGYLKIGRNYSPSTNWSLVGPIIDRKSIRWNKDGETFYAWIGGHDYIDPLHEPLMEGHTPIEWDAFQYGETLLVAIVRAHVESELGEEVEVPDELARMVDGDGQGECVADRPRG